MADPSSWPSAPLARGEGTNSQFDSLRPTVPWPSERKLVAALTGRVQNLELDSVEQDRQ